jgi:hypothetical protein
LQMFLLLWCMDVKGREGCAVWGIYPIYNGSKFHPSIRPFTGVGGGKWVKFWALMII